MYKTDRANNYFIYTMIYFISGSMLLAAILGTSGREISIAANIAISQLAFVFLPVVAYFMITRDSVRETLMLRPITLANIGFSLAIGLLILPVLSFINVLSQLFVKNYIGEALFQTMSMPYWLNILLIGVLPSVFEELSTRAIIISNYRSQRILTACLVSGLFFGILHLNLNQFAYAFVMGTVMAFTVMTTGSIYSSMIIHFTINSTMVSLQTVLFKLYSFLGDGYDFTSIDPTREELLASVAVSGFMALPALPAVLFVIYAMVRYNKKTQLLKLDTSAAAYMEKEPGKEQPGRVATTSFWASVVLFVSYVVLFEFIL